MTPLESLPAERIGEALAITRIVCISTDVNASAALQSLVSAIVPDARVEAADTSILRGVPTADCAILSVGTMYSMGTSLVHELRARGFVGALIVAVESTAGLPTTELARFGVDAVLPYSLLASALPNVLTVIAEREAKATASPHGSSLLTALRKTQALMAAGTIASTLQHRLNNPLAALLAEAQLLELEPLDAEHASSVRRIVHLCRRVIEVSRAIDGIGGATGSEGNHDDLMS